MKKIIAGIILLLVAVYLLSPSPGFPPPPPQSLQSQEPADTESRYRKAYFTDLSREEIIAHYQTNFWQPLAFKMVLPPEDAFGVIRDQTRSSYLEEIIHPAKQSLYINGFTPTKSVDEIKVNGRTYAAKVTVRMVPSDPIARITVLGMVGVGVYLLIKEYA